jgi:hypothetical protein
MLARGVRWHGDVEGWQLCPGAGTAAQQTLVSCSKPWVPAHLALLVVVGNDATKCQEAGVDRQDAEIVHRHGDCVIRC